MPYARFIVPGLVTLGVVTNAYLNTASSMFVMKIQGTIVDLLVAPLSYGEILAGFVGAAVLRGLLVGGVMWLVAGAFGGFELAHPLLALVLVVLAATAFAALGLLTAIWASTFEQVNFFPTFFITPLTFLGGVFYSIDMLPASAPRPHPREPGVLHGGRGALRDARALRRFSVGGRSPARRAEHGLGRGRVRGAAVGLQAPGLTEIRAPAGRDARTLRARPPDALPQGSDEAPFFGDRFSIRRGFMLRPPASRGLRASPRVTGGHPHMVRRLSVVVLFVAALAVAGCKKQEAAAAARATPWTPGTASALQGKVSSASTRRRTAT